MSSLNRRRFLGATAGTAAYLAHSRPVSAALAEVPPPPQIRLGKTGIEMSRLGQGTGMHGWNRQSDQTRLGFAKLVSLFQHAYHRGITFFDLADLYGTHIYFREALRSIPREKVTILTKLWWRYDHAEGDLSSTAIEQSARTTLERFHHELATDYLDIVLLHCMQSPHWDRELAPYMHVLQQAKEKGHIRALGVSCHDYGALQTAARSEWVDVLLARINPRGVKMDGSPEKIADVLQQARNNGKGILGMKIFGEGRLTDQKEECIRFAQQRGVLDAMTIGFTAPDQIDEVLKLMAKYPAKALT